MADYKHTLNLLQTDFPMKANLVQREPETIARWEALDLYARQREARAGAEKFVLHDGPPYANGRLHLGHALNRTLKDTVCKSKALSGFDTPFVPGWDCHGLPIELNVEKKMGKAGDKKTPREFRDACRAYAKTQIEVQRGDAKRLGVLGDWDHPYLTMDAAFEANVVRALMRMMENGHLYRGQKPVHWCPLCASALAEAEVEYKDKTSPAIDVAFAVCDPTAASAALGVTLEQLILPIWTTTPWTLPANQAVCLHAALAYVVLTATREGAPCTLLVAKELQGPVAERYALSDVQVLATVNGEALEGLLLQHPFLDRQVPVVVGEHVTTDAGTGCVHTAPVHGQDDYQVGLRYDLPLDNPVNAKSCFVDDTPHFAGLHVYKANEPVIEHLKTTGALLHHEDMQHSYPHCWRHKTPLIFRATPQWFISMTQSGLRDKAIAAADTASWMPASGSKRFHSMLDQRPDWCISRQRAWGTPIPFLVHIDTGELHPQMGELLSRIADRIEVDGLEAWHDMAVSDLIDTDVDAYTKTTDTLDVWFDAGVTHFAVLDQRDELQVPADLYLEGSDQHRGWFQTSLLSSVAVREAAPFRGVLTHGYVVDKNGHKMSKSIGNVVTPEEVIKKYGADILRLWAVSCDYTAEVSYSEEVVKRVADAYRRLRNTARFLLSNLFDFDAAQDAVPFSDMVALDAWAVAFTADMQQQVRAAYDAYQFQTVYQLIHNFCSVSMGSFYLDIVKDRLYTVKANAQARRSCQTALHFILQSMVRWIAPLVSFTADEIWQYAGNAESSVFLSTWYTVDTSLPSVNLADFAWLSAVRDSANRVLEEKRKAGDIGSALDARVTVFADGEQFDQLAQLGDELRFLLITSDAQVRPLREVPQAPEAGETFVITVDVLSDEKCARCWQRRPDVGAHAAHPSICGRCVENVDGDGEARQYA